MASPSRIMKIAGKTKYTRGIKILTGAFMASSSIS